MWLGLRPALPVWVPWGVALFPVMGVSCMAWEGAVKRTILSSLFSLVSEQLRNSQDSSWLDSTRGFSSSIVSVVGTFLGRVLPAGKPGGWKPEGHEGGFSASNVGVTPTKHGNAPRGSLLAKRRAR